MTQNTQTYEVKCRTCRTPFKVALFESHEKNLFVADKKDWYCDACKKAYFQKQTAEITGAQQEQGFPPLAGTGKMVSWAVKIRAEMMQKLDYFRKSLTFTDDAEKVIAAKAVERLLDEWRQVTDAKWWIDRRTMNVRDMSQKIQALATDLRAERDGAETGPRASD